MKSQIELGRILGIRIGLHYSWFLIALLLVLSFYGNFGHLYPAWDRVSVIALAVLTTGIFFGSLLLHELAHSAMAIRFGMRVREITLFALGGISQIEGDLPRASSEFWIAIVGPLTSAAIGIVCLGMAGLLAATSAAPLVTMLNWVGYINLVLAAFNLLPGYPMDGGRILRSLLWWKWGNLDRATRTAAKTGSVLAVCFIVIGIVDFFRGGGIGALWTAFIGWFLLEASRGSYLEARLKDELENIRVGDLMIADPAAIDGHASVQDFVDHELLRTGRRCFVVREDGSTVGIITPHDVRRVERDAWSTTPVDRVMHTLDSVRTVEPDTSLLEALKAMARANLNQIPVFEGDRCVGLLSRADIVAWLQTQTELKS